MLHLRFCGGQSTFTLFGEQTLPVAEQRLTLGQVTALLHAAPVNEQVPALLGQVPEVQASCVMLQ
jgi:hypothetical protein